MAHQPDLLEQLEGAVDRGEVDIGHGRTDLLRRRMPESADGLEHLVPLRRHAQAAGAQPGGEVGVDWHPSHRRRARACPRCRLALLYPVPGDRSRPGRARHRTGRSGPCGGACGRHRHRPRRRVLRGLPHPDRRAGRSGVDKLPAHLARMQRSAAALDIPFDEAAWRALIDAALDACRNAGRVRRSSSFSRAVRPTADRPGC